MKILHIASFNGNIGDNFSHNGFRYKMSSIVNEDIIYTNLEMREFYQSWNKRKFDSDEFVELCNQHDLVVLGGGNYLEAKWEYSKTGTNFDISIERLKQISTPILFNSLGVDVIGSGSDELVERFITFLKYILNEKKYFLGLRNDGSREIVSKLLDKQVLEKVENVYDNAFYFEKEQPSELTMLEGKKILGINIGKDMKDIRWAEGTISYNGFLDEMTKSIEEFLDKFSDYEIVFFPHIYSDLEAINDIINKVNDIDRRTKLMVAPLVTGQMNEKVMLNMYSKCDLVWSMRFHASVCPIVYSIPTIALYCHDRIKNLYNSLQLEDRMIDVRKEFRKELIEETYNSILNKEKLVKRYQMLNNIIQKDGERYFDLVKNWLISLNIIESNI